MTGSSPGLKDMVSALISAPSVSSTQSSFDQSNAGVIELLANWLDSLGFRVQTNPVAGKPGKFNLIARLGAGKDGLLLSGHSDTVPFDEHLWRSNPLQVHERDNKWFGLGSCDMKSFFAICIEAAKPLLAEKFQRPLVIMATADEESSMSGARQLQRHDLDDVRFAVIGEPTDLKPITRHKGISMFRLRIDGASGHSSDPGLGNNAIEGMHVAVSELMACRAELQDSFQDRNFDVIYPTLNFGCIQGGDNPNRICDHTELAFDLRHLPSMDMTGFTEELRHRLTGALAGRGFNCELALMHAPVPAFDNAGSDLAQEIEQLAMKRSGAVAFGTEAPFLSALALDTVVIGPGSIKQAHQPDEFLPLEQINPATELLRSLIGRHCL